MKILVVEDTAEVQRSLTRVLERAGHQVVVAENGLEALAQLGAGTFEAVVCDLALPFLQGNRFYAQLRDDYPALAQRTVFVTGFTGDASAEKFLKGTGQPYLSKPFEASELLAALESVTTPPADRP